MAKAAKKQSATVKKTVEVAPGARVRTNAAFLRLFAGNPSQWRGEALSAVPTMPGTWRVKVDGIGAPQWISEKFLEVDR